MRCSAYLRSNSVIHSLPLFLAVFTASAVRHWEATRPRDHPVGSSRRGTEREGVHSVQVEPTHSEIERESERANLSPSPQ